MLGIYLGALMVLAATDLDQKLLPDVITLPLIPFALLMVVLGLDPLLAGKDLALVSALAAGIGAPLLLLLTDRLFGGALGMGDVKLAVSLGPHGRVSPGCWRGFLVASIAGAVVLLVLIALRRIEPPVGHPVRAHPHRRRGHRRAPALTADHAAVAAVAVLAVPPRARGHVVRGLRHLAERLSSRRLAPSGRRAPAEGGAIADRGSSLRVVRP